MLCEGIGVFKERPSTETKYRHKIRPRRRLILGGRREPILRVSEKGKRRPQDLLRKTSGEAMPKILGTLKRPQATGLKKGCCNERGKHAHSEKRKRT
jgi:hypothetical protein